MTTVSPPRSAANNVAPKLTRFSQAGVTSPRIVLNAVEGFGKTTLGAFAPNPAILMARGETGFATLRQANRVPDVDAVELSSWNATLRILEDLEKSDHESIVLDAVGGFERLCHEHVCARDFGNDWGERGFSSFQRGPDVAVSDWLGLLQRLDRIRTMRPVNIILLSHAKVQNFKNPLGPDFDRYVPDCHAKTWSVTHKWADVVMFGQFVTVTQEDRKTKRVRGIGGTERVVYTQRTDAFDAKNRYGMAAQIPMTESKEMWPTVWSAMNGKNEPENTGITAPEL